MNEHFLNNFKISLINNNFYKTDYNDIFFKQIGEIYYVLYPHILENRVFNLPEFNGKVIFIEIIISDNDIINDNELLYKEVDLDADLINIVWGVNLSTKKIITKKNQPTKLLKIEKIINKSFTSKDLFKKTTKIYNCTPYLSYGIISILFLIYSITFKDLNNSIIHFASNRNDFLNGEFYRVFTAIFLHSSLMHLLLNSACLLIMGHFAEKFLPSRVFLSVFLIGGIISSIFSMISSNLYSVGASGAIFAIEGALLYFCIYKKTNLDFLNAYNLFILILISIVSGFGISSIDNAGHIGGLLGGILVYHFFRKV